MLVLLRAPVVPEPSSRSSSRAGPPNHS